MGVAGPVAGVDIGGTKVLALAVDPLTGQELARRQVPTPYDPGRLLDQVTTVVAELQAEVGPLVGVGLGTPGLVDRRGVLRYAPNLPGVFDLDLTTPVHRLFDLPVVAENDASCAALAEHRLGAARGADHAVVITQGTGIGGGIIVDGRLLRGAHGFAGEPGHILIDPAGPRCACGAPGHWEAVASGTGLANLARQLVGEGRGAGLLARAGGDPAALRGEHVSAALDDGDADAAEVLRRFAAWVAHGLATLVSLFDPEVIVLGGGLSVISGDFLDAVRVALPETVLAWSHRPAIPVVPAQLGAEAGAVGAALALWASVEGPS
jgi:glucokinase